MDWQKIKEKATDHIVGLIFLLITFLFGLIWKAVPSETWTRLLAAIPTPALAASLALSLIGLATAIAYIFSLRRKQKRLEADSAQLQAPVKEQPADPFFLPKFGVLWDEHIEPYCPLDRILLNWRGPVDAEHFTSQTGYTCPKCKSIFLPVYLDGTALAPNDARYYAEAEYLSYLRKRKLKS
jgi:hypothetical protein